MSKFGSIQETLAYWASRDLEEGEREKIEDHERVEDLNIDYLVDNEIVSVTFEEEGDAQHFLSILQEILGD